MKTTTTLQSRIAETVDAIGAKRDQEKIVLTNLGQAVADNGGVRGQGETFKAAQTAVDSILDDINQSEEQLRALLRDEERRSAIAEERKALSEELKSLDGKTKAAEEDLGAAAWEVWKNGPASVVALEGSLEDLIRAQDKLRDAEDTLYRWEHTVAEDSKAKQILNRGKTLILQNRRRSASSAFERQIPKAGRKVFEAEGAGLPETGAAAEAYATLQALDDERTRIAKNDAILAEEIETLDDALESFPGKGSAKRKTPFIEKSLDDARSQLDDAYRDLGELWLAEGIGGNLPAAVKDRKAEIQDITDAVTELEIRKSTLEAHLAHQEKEAERDRQAKIVADLEKDLEKRRSRLKDEKKSLAGLDKEAEALKNALPPLPEDPESTE